MRFRPCIDLKDGRVVQIVGGSLEDENDSNTEVNFSTTQSSKYFAERYRQDNLSGGHVIALGKGNDAAALAALAAYPGGLHYGGGVTPSNAAGYLEAGASHVIVTSYVFRNGVFDRSALDELLAVTGKEKLVLDLSCRKKDGDYFVVTDRWQRFTEEKVDAALLNSVSEYCDELLVHGVDVEGKMQGIEEELISLLGEHCSVPVTYAGGIASLDDMEKVKVLGQGRVDATIGSALDIFGGQVFYSDVLAWQQQTSG